MNKLKLNSAFWRDVRFLKWAGQIIFLLIIFNLIRNFFGQAITNLNATNLPFSWRFLGSTPGIQVSEGFVTYPESGLQALQIGMANMLRITVSGIFFATFLGTLMGIARLSKNWIVERATTGFVETVRNIPLLVQIFFWQAVILSFPRLEEVDRGQHVVHISAKGIAFPWLDPGEASWLFGVWFLISFSIARRVFKLRVAKLEREGVDTRPGLFAFGAFITWNIVGWFGGYKAIGTIGFIASYISMFFDLLPKIGLQLSFIVVASYYAFRYISREIKRTRSAENRGILTDDDVFRIIIAALLVLILIIGLFLPLGNSLVDFLLGNDLFFKADWGIPQFFDGIQNKLNWEYSGSPFTFSYPEAIQAGSSKFTRYSPDVGKIMSVGYFATWVGVILYTSVFISEVVRSGIMAVAKGQSEAGLSLGLRRRTLLRLIVLPQALRIMLPPMGNQYLNLAKNTSLGIAVAYPEIVAVGQTLYNQEGQTIAVFIVWMAFYSTISLTLSTIVNYYNRKMKIVER